MRPFVPISIQVLRKCDKLANLASREGLENLGYSSKERIREIANFDQNVADKLIKAIKNFFGIEIDD